MWVRRNPAVRVLALSMHVDVRRVDAMLEAGATGYVPKSCQFEELCVAIRTVAAGERYVGGGIAPGIANRSPGDGSKGATTHRGLSPRERQVLKRVADGATTKAIAASLHLSPKTIEMHRGRIMARLDIHSIAELTKYAIREGLTDVDG